MHEEAEFPCESRIIDDSNEDYGACGSPATIFFVGPACYCSFHAGWDRTVVGARGTSEITRDEYIVAKVLSD